MKEVTYCPYCNKYAEHSLHFCPFCSSQAIFWPSWDKKTDEEKEAWKKKWPQNNPPKPLFSNEVRMRRAERFDKQTKEELAQEAELAKYAPKCPVCGCPHLDKIGAGSKLIDVAVWGFASRKPGKQFKCKACGYEF